jgi:hypothetical protein
LDNFGYGRFVLVEAVFKVCVAVVVRAQRGLEDDNALMTLLNLVFLAELPERISGCRAVCSCFRKVAGVPHTGACVVKPKVSIEHIQRGAHKVDVIDNGERINAGEAFFDVAKGRHHGNTPRCSAERTALDATILSGYHGVGTVVKAEDERGIFPIFGLNVMVHRLEVGVAGEFIENKGSAHPVEAVSSVLRQYTVRWMLSQVHPNPVCADFNAAGGQAELETFVVFAEIMECCFVYKGGTELLEERTDTEGPNALLLLKREEPS